MSGIYSYILLTGILIDEQVINDADDSLALSVGELAVPHHARQDRGAGQHPEQARSRRKIRVVRCVLPILRFTLRHRIYVKTGNCPIYLLHVCNNRY